MRLFFVSIQRRMLYSDVPVFHCVIHFGYRLCLWHSNYKQRKINLGSNKQLVCLQAKKQTYDANSGLIYVITEIRTRSFSVI